MTRLNIQNDDRADSPGRREADQQPGIMKVLSITLGCITVVSLIFTAGYNWRGVDTLGRNVEELRKNEDQFVRKDVQSEQQRYIIQGMAEISRQVEELRSEVKGRRKE